MVELSIQEDHTYVLQVDQDRVGSVLVDPLDGINPNTLTIEYNDWALEKLPRPLWYLHGLMIEPAEQRNGMGLIFLEGVLQLMKVEGGTIVLDCWEGNIKLRAFYQKAGFSQKGTFPESDYKIAVYYRSNLAVWSWGLSLRKACSCFISCLMEILLLAYEGFAVFFSQPIKETEGFDPRHVPAAPSNSGW
jgi:GNAT superfamily N-acetyltransferase